MQTKLLLHTGPGKDRHAVSVYTWYAIINCPKCKDSELCFGIGLGVMMIPLNRLLPSSGYHSAPFVMPSSKLSSESGQGKPRCMLVCALEYDLEISMNTSSSGLSLYCGSFSSMDTSVYEV